MTLDKESEVEISPGIDRRKFIERFLKAGACAAPLVYVLFDPARSLGLKQGPGGGSQDQVPIIDELS